jgi:hypothetical protein
MQGNLAGYNKALWLLDIRKAMGSFFILNATTRFQKMVGFSRANCLRHRAKIERVVQQKIAPVHQSQIKEQ